jgi:hypothetical protein
MFNMESVRMRVTNLRINFQIPNPSGSLLTIIWLEANYRFHAFFFSGATALIWALVYLNETLCFASVY